MTKEWATVKKRIVKDHLSHLCTTFFSPKSMLSAAEFSSCLFTTPDSWTCGIRLSGPGVCIFHSFTLTWCLCRWKCEWYCPTLYRPHMHSVPDTLPLHSLRRARLGWMRVSRIKAQTGVEPVLYSHLTLQVMPSRSKKEAHPPIGPRRLPLKSYLPISPGRMK